nr:mechanosensitive ion channel [bacterium]
IMLRITRPFRIGDFIRVEALFGRVTEQGLFDTEIQTESRELIALPNAYLIRHPISTTLRSGAIVSATLSLGYDVHHGRCEPLLVAAAETSGLEEPFVHILELGDFSVTYRISGLLRDTDRLITARSNLCRAVLDTLHGAGIEIMSPAFMNQRRRADDDSTIPEPLVTRAQVPADGGEHVTFDKAEAAEQREAEKQQLEKTIKDLEESLKDAVEEERVRIKAAIAGARERLKAFQDAGNQAAPP